MAQHLKDEVHERIARAALAVFARDGFAGATMADIARAAGVATGNLYRYHASKDALFHAVVDDAFVARLGELLRRRVEAAAGAADPRQVEGWRAAAEDLLRFAVEHRERVVILLGRAEGTRHEGFAPALVAELVERAIDHVRSLRPDFAPPDTLRFDLTHIYRSLVAGTVAILARFEAEADIRAAVEAYTRYHIAGLEALFR